MAEREQGQRERHQGSREAMARDVAASEGSGGGAGKQQQGEGDEATALVQLLAEVQELVELRDEDGEQLELLREALHRVEEAVDGVLLGRLVDVESRMAAVEARVEGMEERVLGGQQQQQQHDIFITP